MAGRGAGFRDTGQVTHHIDPRIDAERDRLIATFRRWSNSRKCLASLALVRLRDGRNGAGDFYQTDSQISLGVLVEKAAESAPRRS